MITDYSITIDAPTATVWTVFADVGHWADHLDLEAQGLKRASEQLHLGAPAT